MFNNSVPNNNFSAINSYKSHEQSDRKKTKNEITKEGVVVNTFIKDVDTYKADTPVQSTPLPKDMFDKKDNISASWFKNPIVPMIAVPLLVLGAGAALTAIYKKSMTNKYKLDEKLRLPSQGRVITINNDISMSLLMLVQDPTQKNLQVATAVIAASATSFILKNVVDGFKEVFVKKQVADIKRDKEEKLIDIETRSFSGKNQIIRSLMEQKAAELDNLTTNQTKPANKQLLLKSINSFAANENNQPEKDNKTSGKLLLNTGLAVASIALTGLFAKSIFKNLRTVAKSVEEKAAEVSASLKTELSSMKKLNDLEENLEKSSISAQAKDIAREQWAKIHDPSNISAPPPELTNYKGKTGFSSFVIADATAFIYTWMINKNPQTQALAMLMCSAAGLGYLGQTAVKGVKEVQVEKANAKTEVDLQDRLVNVELNNFYQKKKSYISPLMDDYKEKIKQPLSGDEVKKMKENILTEIKSGPPFVYS